MISVAIPLARFARIAQSVLRSEAELTHARLIELLIARFRKLPILMLDFRLT